MLLQWREGDPKWLDQTRYMEIEHGYEKENEYKERLVLPDAFGVIKNFETALKDESPETKVLIKPSSAGYVKGTVTKFGLGPTQSFGFIRPDNEKDDIFVHIKSLSRGVETLREGQRVLFKKIKGMKGFEAKEVKLEE
jgi:CspA family cold shock protein